MATVKGTFSLKDEDVNKIKEAIKDCGEYSEKVINDYLHNVGGENIAKSITNFLPRSNRNKVHAKDKKWYKQSNYNLSVSIENASKFYYLYYVATGTGTSKMNEPNSFMEDGLEKESSNVVNGIVNELINNINKELK